MLVIHHFLSCQCMCVHHAFFPVSQIMKQDCHSYTKVSKKELLPTLVRFPPLLTIWLIYPWQYYLICFEPWSVVNSLAVNYEGIISAMMVNYSGVLSGWKCMSLNPHWAVFIWYYQWIHVQNLSATGFWPQMFFCTFDFSTNWQIVKRDFEP
jgi:hypothetical protein